ncbi:toll/interleukin-1 receptor domain-containing protein [Streptomyces sp. NPDC046909]|uniref:toll/interleukin-1 receptor domain-containing protein n=1 Tax=Streptomyces sp. NPDC046909 TaxID=3155617 RepID=UPI0033F435EA
MSGMRTVYLQKSLSMNGRGALGGRVLVDRLRAESEDLLLGHVVFREENVPPVDSPIRRDVISETEFLGFAPNVVVMEGGLLTGRDGTWRLVRPLAEEFVEDGGTLIVADADFSVLHGQQAGYLEAADFLGARATYRAGSWPLVGQDNMRNSGSQKVIRCLPDRMYVSDWLRPVYDGIPEILCSWPVRLHSFKGLLASCNRDSTTVYADGGPESDHVPWASVCQTGAGFVVLMAGRVTNDVWQERCPHNTAWMVNVCRFLTDAADVERRRNQAATRSPESLFLSHAHRDKDLVSATYRLLRAEHAVGTWIDAEELLPGDSLTEHVTGAVSRATAFVLFWSEAAATSSWVRRELDIALDTPTPTLLVVRLDHTPLPDRLAELVRIEAADISPLEIAGKLAETIRKRRRRERIEEARRRGH